MRASLLKPLIIGFSILITVNSYAANADEIFKKECVKSWMERADKTNDKVGFQNFGEKYCSCAAGKSLNNDEEITKAARLCMSQTFLHDTMSSIEEEEGLKDLTEAKIHAACVEEWKMIYPDLDSAESQVSTYCQCAAPKLIELNNDRDNVTDQQWSDKIDSIAADCANTIAADKASTGKKS